ncbi:MAG: hypothetical protein ACXWEY_15710, partial [Bacteroidia bacterium]
KPKGAISAKTIFWNELSDFVTTGGAEKFKQELMKLEGKEFVQAYSNILEFFKPKLARQEIKAEIEPEKIKTHVTIIRTREQALAHMEANK